MDDSNRSLSPLLLLALGAIAAAVWLVTFPFAVLHWAVLRLSNPRPQPAFEPTLSEA